MPFKPLLSLLILSLGVLGAVACGAGIAAVWSVGSRLSRTNEKVFDGIDESLVAVRDRVLGAQRRVQESAIKTEDVEQRLRNWTRKKTSERLESRFDVEARAKQLSLDLQQSDLWLELSEASIRSVQQVLELGSSMGAPVDAAMVEPLVGKLDSLRSHLTQAIETVDGIHERAADVAEGASPEERIDQAVQLALRVVVTFGEIDVHLGEFADRLSETRTKGQHLKSQTHVYIVTSQIGAVLLFAWMAAGQVCLCLHGWKNYRRYRSMV